MLPKVPKETTKADMVANLSGPNHKVISFRVPIRLQAIPAPRSNLPATRDPTVSPHAKTYDPATPSSESAVMAILGPIASRYMLIGICMTANA